MLRVAKNIVSLECLALIRHHVGLDADFGSVSLRLDNDGNELGDLVALWVVNLVLFLVFRDSSDFLRRQEHVLVDRCEDPTDSLQ